MNADNSDNLSTINNSDVELLSLETPTTSEEITYPTTPSSAALPSTDTASINSDDAALLDDDNFLTPEPESPVLASNNQLKRWAEANPGAPKRRRVASPASPQKVTELPQWNPTPAEEDETDYGQHDAWERGEEEDYPASQQEASKHRWWKVTYMTDYTDFCQKEICMAVDYLKYYYQQLLEITSIICLIMGIEICPTTKKVHAHLLIGLNESMRYSTMKKYVKNAQLRHLQGDPAIVTWYDYVVKAFSKIIHPNRIMMWGADVVINKKNALMRSQKRNHRDLFYDNRQAIEDGRFEDIDPVFRFDNMSKINKWYLEQHKAAIKVKHDRLVFIWGEPGVGKTSLFSRNIDPSNIYWKNPSNRWWCGYRDQPIVIIDEITPKDFMSGNINWNIIGDRNEVFVEVKGAQVPLQAQWVIVISNYRLDALCTLPKKGFQPLVKKTFKRRCGDIKHGYRIWEYPQDERNDNGDLDQVTLKVKEIFKHWFYDVYPYFRRLNDDIIETSDESE